MHASTIRSSHLITGIWSSPVCNYSIIFATSAFVIAPCVEFMSMLRIFKQIFTMCSELLIVCRHIDSHICAECTCAVDSSLLLCNVYCMIASFTVVKMYIFVTGTNYSSSKLICKCSSILRKLCNKI
jgi:hypothetical protein